MNILPKKRWHVRTKENIARVRKDEAEAAEKAKQENLRIENAERESRLQVLKQISKEKLSNHGIETNICESVEKKQEHINFFSNIEHAVKTTNASHDKEIKEKKEAYEKKIGYLTYLGQDTNEALGKKNWYDLPPESTRFLRSSNVKDTYDKLVLNDKEGKPKVKVADERNGEINWKSKQSIDPLNSFKKYCSTEKYKAKINDCNVKSNLILVTTESSPKTEKEMKKKSHKKNHKDDRISKLQKLREIRLKREEQEKYKTKKILSTLSGEIPIDDNKVKAIQPKYNSQFNPELARQNYK